jgi:hypothetical protein
MKKYPGTVKYFAKIAGAESHEEDWWTELGFRRVTDEEAQAQEISARAREIAKLEKSMAEVLELQTLSAKLLQGLPLTQKEVGIAQQIRAGVY